MTNPNQLSHPFITADGVPEVPGHVYKEAFSRETPVVVEPTVGPGDEPKEISMAHLEALAQARHRLAKTGLGSCSTETEQEREVRERLLDQGALK